MEINSYRYMNPYSEKPIGVYSLSNGKIANMANQVCICSFIYIDMYLFLYIYIERYR